jgi:hypothetical protein
MIRRLSAIGAFLLMQALPSVSHACAVCFSATEQNRAAFIETTVLMSLLPLAMIGGVVYWYRKKSRELAHEDPERLR